MTTAVSITARQPPPLKATDGPTEWRIFEKLWNAYAEVTELTKRPAKFQTNLFYSCIGPEGVAIVEKLPFKTAEDQNDLKKAITLLQQRFLGRRNVTYERYWFYQRIKEVKNREKTQMNLLEVSAYCLKHVGSRKTERILRTK